MASPVSHRRLVSSIVYRFVYFLLCVILLGLLVATPGDAINRSFENGQTYNIWILIAAYVLAILTIAFVYFTRLYINKTELGSIPKGWIPIEKGDVRSSVHKVIAAGLGRSASIAFQSRPRLLVDGEEQLEEPVETRIKLGFDGPQGPAEELVVTLPRQRPVWGEIEHYGWASPNSTEYPNIEYATVFSELPNLIEAKALTLAPVDPTTQADPPVLEMGAVELLTQTPEMSLRDYITHLVSLGVLEMDATTTKFLSCYEYARFSTRPVSNARFQELMHLFAEILRAMEPMDPDILDGGMDGDATPSTSSHYGDDEPGSVPGTPLSEMARSEAPSSDVASFNGSVRQIRRQPSTTTWNQYRTAPNSMRSGMSAHGSIYRRSSNNSLARSSHRHHPISQRPSTSSLRSKSSSSSNSVIRLATGHDSVDLPYILSLRDTAGS